MTPEKAIEDALINFVSGRATEAERKILRRALMARKLTLAGGDGSVAIGGKVENSTIITGNGNIVIEGVNADDLRKLLSDLQVLRPGSAPPLPALFVGREDAMRDLRSRLGIGHDDSKPTHPQMLTTVRGWPGIGKTTLAAALAHDEDVNDAFPDGVLWVSLGPEPNVLSELAAWGRAMGSDEVLKARSVEEASAQLTALLRNKRMLLIVDDVWDADHAKRFQVGGRGCAMLITTRQNDVAQAIAPTADSIYRLAVLTDEAAMEILAALCPTVMAQYRNDCLDLVHGLEGLPLALQVAGHMLNVEASYGFSPTELLEELRDGAKILAAQTPKERIGLASETSVTIAVLLQKSTDRLDEFTCDCFAYLGPFAPKPATFDLDAMKFVWQVDDPKPTARALIDRGLLEPVADTGRYQMHALLVAHAKSLLTN